MTDAPATLLSYNGILTREQLALVPTPPGTNTHKPIPHHEVIQALAETLNLYKIGVTKEQHAVSKDGMKHYFTLDLTTGFPGGNFVIGGRNSHDRSLALGITCGYRVTVCQNGLLQGEYTPVMKKHTKNCKLDEALVIGVNSIIRNFDPLVKEIDRWKETQLTDIEARLGIYEAFVEERIEIPKNLMRSVHDHYFNPKYEEFRERNRWSYQNAYTSAIQTLDHIPQQKAAVSIGEYFHNKNL